MHENQPYSTTVVKTCIRINARPQLTKPKPSERGHRAWSANQSLHSSFNSSRTRFGLKLTYTISLIFHRRSHPTNSPVFQREGQRVSRVSRIQTLRQPFFVATRMNCINYNHYSRFISNPQGPYYHIHMTMNSVIFYPGYCHS